MVDKDVCERWWLTKMCVRDGGGQRCVGEMVVDKDVCERWWLTKMRWWLTKMCVRDGSGQRCV